MHRHLRGFTLIELLTAVAIVGILLAIALPTYKNYVTRSRVAEGIALAATAKVAVRHALYEGTAPPLDNEKVGLEAPEMIKGNNVAEVRVSESGTISVLFTDPGGDLDGKVLQFVPMVGAGSILFPCNGEGTTVERVHRPAACR